MCVSSPNDMENSLLKAFGSYEYNSIIVYDSDSIY